MRKINSELLTKNILENTKHDFENNKVFGSCYAVAQGDETIYKEYFGYTSVNAKTPVNSKTIFRLASMTKPITTVATLILVERGLLCLEDEISKYIPDFKDIHVTEVIDDKLVDLGIAKNQPTIFNILSHSAGIGSNSDKNKFLTSSDKENSKTLSDFYVKIGLDYEPGTSQYYSGTGSFAVLGNIIEKITGKSLQEFYSEEIFKPLKMNDTTFIPTEEQWTRVIDMHGRVDGKNVVVAMNKNCGFVDYPCSHCVAGAGLFSTLEDYLKFARMLLNKGNFEDKTIVSETLINMMSSPQVEIESTTYWGLGVRVIRDGHPYLPKGSFGWSGAYGSHFWVNPLDNTVAVFMKNSTVDGGAGNESSRYFECAVKNSYINE